MNKKGNYGAMISFFLIAAVILVLGFAFAIGGGVMNLFMDEIVPEVNSIGTIGSANVTEYAGYGLGTLNTVVQSFSWLGGVAYAILIIGLFGIAVTARVTMNRFFIGMFFVIALLMVLLSIFMSNIYQDFYEDNGELGDRLKEQTLLSFLILHSPLIFIGVILISGVVLFSGVEQGGEP